MTTRALIRDGQPQASDLAPLQSCLLTKHYAEPRGTGASYRTTASLQRQINQTEVSPREWRRPPQGKKDAD